MNGIRQDQDNVFNQVPAIILVMTQMVFEGLNSYVT